MHVLHVRSPRFSPIAFGLSCAFAVVVFGADANPIAVKNVSAGLKDPAGVAVRPDGSGEAYEVFFAESGAGRIAKIRSDKPEKRIDVVSGFSSKPASNDDGVSSSGIQSLYFLDHMRLVVAGGNDDGAPFIRLYELPEPESPLTADQHKQEANVPEGGKETNFDAHVFRNIARTQANDRVGDFLLVAALANTNSESSGLAYVPIRAGTLGDAVPARLKNTNEKSQIGGIAVGNNGYVVVALNAAGNSSQPSQLAFFSPLDRRIVMQVSTKLQHIVAIAFSPKTGNLFVANASKNDEGSAGIYRIDSANQPSATACTAVKIADIKRPTALAFAPDGVLYVTGSVDPKSKDAGILLKVTGDL